jgi:hypothetical protein
VQRVVLDVEPATDTSEQRAACRAVCVGWSRRRTANAGEATPGNPIWG